MQQDQPPPAESPRIPLGRIDVEAAKVLRRLARSGFDAYLVGGCVRDLLLNRKPKDFDIATSARPRQVRRLFRNSRIIGRRFRLAHIHFGDRVLEVATFRAPPLADDEEDPYIRRDNVYGTEHQDAFRRDFTINGLFYDLEHERVIDHVGGLADLERGLLRTIGDPDLRLREDPVRILRAAKFAGRLGFELAPDLREAATRQSQDLAKAAPPRVLEEFYRLLSGQGSAKAFTLLDELGALEVLLPELSPIEPAFFCSLERLEEATGGDRNRIDHAVLLSVLIWPRVGQALLEEPGRDVEGHVHELLEPFMRKLTCSRRDAARARQCMAAQVRLAQPATGRTARRFARREIFADALLLRELVGPLGDVDPALLEDWKKWRAEDAGARPEPAGPGRRRRRRRRRRRKTP